MFPRTFCHTRSAHASMAVGIGILRPSQQHHGYVVWHVWMGPRLALPSRQTDNDSLYRDATCVGQAPQEDIGHPLEGGHKPILEQK